MTGQPTPFDSDLTAQVARLRFALQAATVGTWDYDLLTGQAQWSAICKELFGLPAEAEVTAPILLQQVHPQDRQRVGLANAQVLSPGSDGRHNIRFRTLNPQGALRWVEAKGQVLRGSQGEAIRFSGIVQEVTERVLDRQKLEDSEARFRSLIEEAPLATCLFVGRNMVVEVANETMLGYWGKDQSAIGRPLQEAVPELKGQPFLQILDDVFTTGRTYEARNAPAQLAINGVLSTYYFDFTYKPLRDATGEIYAVMDSAVDVTQKVMAQQALEASEARFRSIIEQAPVAVALFSGPDFIITLANERVLTFWGRAYQQVIDKPLFEALPEARGQGYEALLREVYTTGRRFVATELPVNLERNGRLEPTYIDFVYDPYYEADGRLSGVIVLCVETTQQVLARQVIEASESRYRALSAELEQQVQRRTDELRVTVEDLQRSNANLEQFAYIASHDLQEPLRKVQQFGDLLVNQYGDRLGEGLDYVQRMQSAANRMSTLVRDLLTYSRITPQQEGNQRVSLTAVVQAVLTDLELLVGETRAIIDLSPLPTVPGDASQLAQLFHNLLNNALKFSRRNELGQSIPPLVSIKATLVRFQDLPPLVKPARAVEDYHRIDVRDNGIGFDIKHLDRIFQVFQRLHGKSAYAGTGIGLAICEKVVINHGGAITASSQVGQGATFSVYLPG